MASGQMCINKPPLKVCNQCDTPKEDYEFYKGTKGKRRAKCIACVNENRKKVYPLYREKYIERAKKWMQDNKEAFMDNLKMTLKYQRKTLADPYIKSLARNYGYTKDEITPELVESIRQRILDKRKRKIFTSSARLFIEHK
jgi:hypothetical protein